MDWDYYFYIKVLEPYKIEDILTPKKLKEGEIDNTTISELRSKLDNCFDEIEGYILKEKLIQYIDDYWYNVVSNIISQKRVIKSIKKKIKSLKKESPNLNLNKPKYEKIINEINNYEWLLSQEEFILMYLEEQRFFIRNWASQKSSEFRELPEKRKIQKERNKKETKKLINKVRTDYVYKNKYPKVFLNAKSYLIFKDYTDKITKYELSEYSFIYRVMYERGLINNTIKESAYRKWLSEEFDHHFIKIKRLHSMSVINRVEKFRVLMNKYKPLTT